MKICNKAILYSQREARYTEKCLQLQSDAALWLNWLVPGLGRPYQPSGVQDPGRGYDIISGADAIRLISQAGTEGLALSFLICEQ